MRHAPAARTARHNRGAPLLRRERTAAGSPTVRCDPPGLPSPRGPRSLHGASSAPGLAGSSAPPYSSRNTKSRLNK